MNSEKVKLVVFDWAGTTVDYGSSAPMVVFEDVFQKAGITLSREEINGSMRMEKKAHIRSLLSLKTASEQWKTIYGREWNEKDVEGLYHNFEKRLAEVVAEYRIPIDGVTDIDELLDGAEKAHEYMDKGSVTAGLAFSATRTTACHSISYPLTMKYNISHGTAVSMLLAPVMKLNSGSVEGYRALLDVLEICSADELGKRIQSIFTRADIPFSLKDWGVKDDELPQLDALGITKGRADNNPVDLNEETVLAILKEIY